MCIPARLVTCACVAVQARGADKSAAEARADRAEAESRDLAQRLLEIKAREVRAASWHPLCIAHSFVAPHQHDANVCLLLVRIQPQSAGLMMPVLQ